MNYTGIDWAEFSWNPLVGCSHGCAYCYAREQAKRQVGCADCVAFVPHFHPERLDQPRERKTPATIFAVSMGDAFDPHVLPEWQEALWQAMRQAAWHTFVVLTKRPDLIAFDPPANLLVGVTVTSNADAWRVATLCERIPERRVVSFEPLHGPCDAVPVGDLAWAIIGAETGRRANRVVPEVAWARELRDRAQAAGVPVFDKGNLVPILQAAGVTVQQEGPRVPATTLF